MTALDWDHFYPIAESVARKVAAEYPGIDWEDIRQEILVHVAARADIYAGAVYPDGTLRNNFRQVALSYAGRERAAYMHGMAAHLYTSKEVRALLENAFFRPECWEKPPAKDNGTHVAAGGVVAALWDLDAAYQALPPNDALVVAARYDLGETLDNTDTVRLTRAIDRMARAMNSGVARRKSAALLHDGPGPRRPGQPPV